MPLASSPPRWRAQLVAFAAAVATAMTGAREPSTAQSRVATRIATSVILCVVTIALGTALAVSMGVELRGALFAVSAGAIGATLLVTGALAVNDRGAGASRDDEPAASAAPVAVAAERVVARADQEALARAHAELEARHRQQVAAWRDERAAIVETLSAEIAHEVRYPINFFRSIFRRGASALDSEEVEIGSEEVERLERLVSGLRRFSEHRLERRTVPIAEIIARAETLLRDDLRGRSIVVELPADLALRCDPDQVTQILVNLFANAIEATQPSQAIGIRWRPGVVGRELVVWDRGAGFTGEASQLFAPWFTTKPRGTGLGLAITHRLVRAHGWRIDALRHDATTELVIGLPSSDVVHPRTPSESEPG